MTFLINGANMLAIKKTVHNARGLNRVSRSQPMGAPTVALLQSLNTG